MILIMHIYYTHTCTLWKLSTVGIKWKIEWALKELHTLSPQTTRKSSLQGLWLMDRTVNGTEVVLRR